MYDFSTFDTFIASTIGQTIGNGDAVDYVNLIWNHLGSQLYTYPPSDPGATDHAIKWSVLNADALEANKIPGITYIPNINDVKRGDIVILTGQVTGHGGFIDTNYHGTDLYGMYSQNIDDIHSVVLRYFDLSDFGGAFRYNDWNKSTEEKRNFPWVLYARKFRNRNNL